MHKFTITVFLVIFCSLIYAQENGDFSLCDDGKLAPYYYPELKYEGGFYVITSFFKENYNTNKFKGVNDVTGIVTIQFHVNCSGQTGDYIIKNVDLDYNENHINAELNSHLLDLTKMLDKWTPAKDDNQNTVNSHKFLSFRIIDGKLVEIFPK